MTCPLDVQPYDQSQPVQTPQFTNLNYTSQDYFSMKNRLRDLLKQNFPDDFTDLIESDLAIMLIEMWAFLADLLSFKMDQIANEVFIDTVSELDNAFRLAKLVGFQPMPPIAATAFVSATMNNVLATDLVIPGGLQFKIVSQNQSVYFELFPANPDNTPDLDDNIVITAGSLTNTAIVALEGQTTQDLFNGTGQAGQSFLLLSNPVIFDSIRVNVDGIRWTQVDYFSNSSPQRQYRVEYDSNYNAYVIFGDGTSGLAPSNGSVITVQYRVGGGSIGNIVTGALNVQRNVSVDGFQFNIPVTFYNYTPGQNGYDGDGIDDIRNKLPSYLAIQNRCVTGEDYKNFAEQFVTPYQGQVGKATAVLRNYGCAANIIDLYILALVAPAGLTQASDDLKTALQTALGNVQMLTDYVCLRDGLVLPVDVTVDVTIDKFYKNLKDEIQLNLLNQTNAFFGLANWDYGQTLQANDLIKYLVNVQQAISFDITFTTSDPNNSGATVTANFNEIIRPDTISVNLTFQ